MADTARGSVAGDSVRYGDDPLPQTVAAAAVMRRLAGMLVSLEHPHPAVDDLITGMAAVERELAAAMPRDMSARIGTTATDAQRVYLDHSRDTGHYNPCFPEYQFVHIDREKAHGTVNFPVVYEGPPGLVFGGFIAVFFDCVTQHQNCAIGMSGKTRTLNLRYRRPTPILTDLRFDITRSARDSEVTSVARLTLDDDVLCTAEIAAISVPADRLTTTHFGKRRLPKERGGDAAP
jgi:hypothetical protein